MSTFTTLAIVQAIYRTIVYIFPYVPIFKFKINVQDIYSFVRSQVRLICNQHSQFQFPYDNHCDNNGNGADENENDDNKHDVDIKQQ